MSQRLATVAVLILTGLLGSLASAAERRPNVVLILVDDFGYECVGANGGESYKTPTLDRLAKTGTRFEQVHVQPLCTPTRVALMTGLINKRNYTRFGHLDPSQKTFGNLFHGAGYATCVVGKWQLQGGYDAPKHFGFDEYCLWQLNRRPPRYANPGLEINGQQRDYESGEYGPDIVNDYAIDFVARQKDKPFLLYYPMMLTHGPYQPTPDSPSWDPKALGEGVNKRPEHFGHMVEYADKLVGRLVSKLDELKLRENTLVLVLGDNGTGKGTPSRFQGRNVVGAKGTSTMWGTRVPGIVNWPGHVQNGQVCQDMIDTTDFLPTICEVAGIEVPGEWNIDGRSFWAQLRGEKGSPRDGLYVWYNSNGGPKAKFEFAHDQQYKLYSDGRFYDVSRDDTEKSRLADSSLDDNAKAVKAKLQTLIDRHQGPRAEYFAKQGTRDEAETAEGTASDRASDKDGSTKPTPSKPADTVPKLKAQDARTTRFEQRDLDHDGKLSWPEFEKTATNKGAAKNRFESFDRDKDGVITRKEFDRQPK